jgi:hypothetical protein
MLPPTKKHMTVAARQVFKGEGDGAFFGVETGLN